MNINSVSFGEITQVARYRCSIVAGGYMSTIEGSSEEDLIMQQQIIQIAHDKAFSLCDPWPVGAKGWLLDDGCIYPCVVSGHVYSVGKRAIMTGGVYLINLSVNAYGEAVTVQHRADGKGKTILKKTKGEFFFKEAIA